MTTVTTDRRRSLLVTLASVAAASGLTALASSLPLLPALLVGWFALAAAVVAFGHVTALVGPSRVEVYEHGSVRIDRRGARLTLN